MARDKLTEYSATASDNTVCGDVNIAENSALPSDLNNFAREIMSHLKNFSDGTDAITGLTVDGNIKLDGNYPTGTNNVALGNTALDDGSLSGSNNTAIGHAALTANTTGTENVAIGKDALASNQTGGYNIAVGVDALQAHTGNHAIAIGRQALENSTTGGGIAIGTQALEANTTGTSNMGIGFNAGKSITTGASNVGIGDYALDATTTAANNTALGAYSLTTNTTGANNVGLGSAALLYNTTGSSNTAVGRQALAANTTAANNTALGYQAGYANTGGSGTFLGRVAGYSNTTGGENTNIGAAAGYSCTTSSNNTMVGAAAGYYATGSENTMVGKDAGVLMTTGSKNTILGRYNGNQGGLDIRTASNYIVLSDGDGNPRQIINSSGRVGFSKTPNGSAATAGVEIGELGDLIASRASSAAAYFNRNTDDGVIIYLMQAGTVEGTISVSGTTVSYNGGHLSRWSQATDGNRIDGLVKGTVMTNLDQMAEWTKDGVTEDNEQLNCMAVSFVEGDANVAGVFVNWDDDDEDYTADMNVAMTGDMVIRIAQGTTVARGDLLMSAGDGTAKPQGDDIVRSKTIAKVTSTNVSHTYDDGSYLVPCVLMAC